MLRESEEYMTEKGSQQPLQRRSFLTRLSVGATAFVAAVAGQSTLAGAQSGAGASWQPARHELDDWMDKLPGKHRFVFDTISADGFGIALPFSNNYYRGNQAGYGLGDSDIAVIIVARHNSTPFAYSDAMWAKYGEPIAKKAGFMDPKTKAVPKSNLFNAAGYGDALANRGVALDALLKRGVHLAVCQLATRAYAGEIAMAVGSTTENIYAELTSNLVSNSHIVPAGIVAVNRAQERGYSFVHA
jgi:intracellular sulfur oxidation DsrE/DsrF family protein